MPRGRKTISGAPAQPVGAVAGQMYGAGVEQMALQRAMPAPQMGSTPTAGPAPSAAPAGAPAPQAGSAVSNFQQAMEAAKGLQGAAGLLTRPTARPNEPITAGLSTGPGPGPEAMQVRMGSPVGEAWRKLSATTGDPFFAELARKARL